MAIKYRNGMLVAQAVIALVLAGEKDAEAQITIEQKSHEKGIDATIGAYSNCREQGLSLAVYNAPYWVEYFNKRKGQTIQMEYFTTYWVAEDRGSTNIVVYHGKGDGSGIDDDAYKNARYFNYNEHYMAAEYILDDIVSRINNSKCIPAVDTSEVKSLEANV